MSIRIAAKVAPKIPELEMVKRAGWKCVEVYTSKAFLQQVFIDNLLKFKKDFEYVVHAPVDYCDKEVIDFTHAIGSKIIVVHGYDNHEDGLQELIDYAESKGILICLENGVREIREPTKIEQFSELKKKFPKVKFTIDVEHAQLCDMFPEVLEKFGKDTRHIHLTGYPPNYHSPPQENPEITRRTFKLLKKLNYDGVVTAEMDMKYQTEKIFKETREFLEKMLKE
jgi:sugar phosphate isomerase/epimerase